MLVNAIEDEWEVVTVFDIPMLFTCSRVDRKTIPQELYAYDVRHADDDWGEPCEITDGVVRVNHFGTLLSKTVLPLRESANGTYLMINPETDWGYEGVYCSIEEFLENVD